MASCEKCWEDAFMRSLSNRDKPQYEHYQDLLQERAENPCSPKEQAGQWWDEKKQCDSRSTHQYSRRVNTWICSKCGKEFPDGAGEKCQPPRR